MTNTYGFGTDTSNFSNTIHNNILKAVVATLRAGLVSLPKGSVVPAQVGSQQGNNFTLISTEYPDLHDSTPTDPLTEGVAPNALKLGISTNSWTVTQSGARTVVTDIAQMQSPHDLEQVAQDKIARLAAEKIDAIGRAALLAGAEDLGDATSPLSTGVVLDVIAAAQARNYEPVPGAGFYFLLHPNALRGLTGEDGLNGYVNVMAESGNDAAITKGAVGQYRGATFLVSTKFVDDVGDGTGAYPIYVMGANAMACGDLATMEFIHWSAPGPGNELAQLMGVGFKGVLGAKVLAFAEGADGAGNNDTAQKRALSFTVTNGVSNNLS